MAVKASFTVGVFGLAAMGDKEGVIRIKVNVRTDQERQKQLAKLPDDSPVKIVDMPGGGVSFDDFSLLKGEGLLAVLRREIAEETGGCTIEPIGEFSGPVMVATNDKDSEKPIGDIAFWMPIRLIGDPKPSNEALDHPWISLQQFEDETEYRCVSGLGKAGRTGRMIRAAFEWYKDYAHRPEIFSKLIAQPLFVCLVCGEPSEYCTCGK